MTFLGRLGATALLSLAVLPFTAQAETVRMFEPGEATAEHMMEALLPTAGRTRSFGASGETEPKPGIIGYRIEFEFDSARIDASNGPFLKEIARMLSFEQMAEQILVIEGHTDAKGTADYNLALSERRALAVRRYLSERFGVDALRLTVRGVGEAQPLRPADPEHPANRRVQFYLQ